MTRMTLGLLALALGLALPARAEPATYTIDDDASELVVFLYKAGPAARLAHDHVIEAEDVSGEITYDPEAPEETAVLVSARAASLTPDPPELLERYDVDGPTDPDDRREIAETLEGEDQLHVARYPTIRFQSSALERTPGGETYLRGDFTLRGVTREVRVPVAIELEGEVLRGQGSFEVRQSDFGYEPYSAYFGAVRVKDEARIRVELVARRAEAPPAGR